MSNPDNTSNPPPPPRDQPGAPPAQPAAPQQPSAPPPPPQPTAPQQPSTPPPQSWQTQPQQPGPPPAAGGVATTMPAGPIAGTTIADFITRLVAFIIDAVILGIASYILWAILGGLLFALGGLALLVHAVLMIAISAGYFIYFWTTRRQTPGMMVMKLMVVQDGTGTSLDQNQAIRRWLYLGLPYALSTLISVGFGFGVFGLGALAILFTLAPLVALIALGWQIYLAYTTYQDPRKQGVHDKAVNSVVISVGPSPLGNVGQR